MSEAHGASTAAPPPPASFARRRVILFSQTARFPPCEEQQQLRSRPFFRGAALFPRQQSSDGKIAFFGFPKKRPKSSFCHQRGERAGLASALQLSSEICQQGAPATDRIGDGSHMELP